MGKTLWAVVSEADSELGNFGVRLFTTQEAATAAVSAMIAEDGPEGWIVDVVQTEIES